MNLTEKHIVKGIDGGNRIITKRQKTKSPVKVLLLGKAEDIATVEAEIALTKKLLLFNRSTV